MILLNEGRLMQFKTIIIYRRLFVWTGFTAKFSVCLNILGSLSKNRNAISGKLREFWDRHALPLISLYLLERSRKSKHVKFLGSQYGFSCTMGTGSIPGVKSGRGVTLTPHLLLVPWSRKGRTIPLLPLWAVRPVQSLSACTRVHFIFTFLIRILKT
jgi:hypothetical protein